MCYFSPLDVYSLQCDHAVACLQGLSEIHQVCRTTTRPQVRIYYGGGELAGIGNGFTPVAVWRWGFKPHINCDSDRQPKNSQNTRSRDLLSSYARDTPSCGEFQKHQYLCSPTYSWLIADLSRPSKRIFSPGHDGACHRDPTFFSKHRRILPVGVFASYYMWSMPRYCGFTLVEYLCFTAGYWSRALVVLPPPRVVARSVQGP